MISLGAVALATATALVAAPTLAFDRAERTEIEGIVRDYLLQNPELIVDVMKLLREKEAASESLVRQKALRENRDQIDRDPTSPVAGNRSGDVTVVEFFDYQCGYCKSVREHVVKLLDSDRNVRLVLKEFPILGPVSVTAARAALAAHAQGRYWDFHNALLMIRGRLTEAAIFDTAKQTGLDVDRLRRDMAKPEIEAIIGRNRELAETLALTGTPAFVIGTQVAPGALGLDDMVKLVAAARTR